MPVRSPARRGPPTCIRRSSYSALAVAHIAGESVNDHERVFVAMAGDINWDGEPISGMSESDAELLAELRSAT